MGKLEVILLSSNQYVFILIFTCLAIFLMLFNLVIVDLTGIELIEREVEHMTVSYAIGSVILAPLIETFIFQKFPIDYFRNRIDTDWKLVLLSAIPFGVSHYFVYFLIRDIYYAFCFGVAFAYAYILAKKRDDLSAYWAVVFIHAGYNLSGVIIHLFIY